MHMQLRLPRRVLGTALSYLKRIYVSHSCLEHDPQQLLLTCLYLACKVSVLAHTGVWREGSELERGLLLACRQCHWWL